MNGIQVGKESVHIKPTETGTVLQARTQRAHRFPWVTSQAKKATNFLTKWLDTFPIWQQHHHTEPLHKFLKEQMIDMHYSGKGLNETAAGNATLTLLPAAAGLAVLLKQLQPNCWVWQILRRTQWASTWIRWCSLFHFWAGIVKKCPTREGVPPPRCVGNTEGQVLFFSSTGLSAWFRISFLVSSKFIFYFLLGLISSIITHLLSLHPYFCLMSFSTCSNFCLFFFFQFCLFCLLCVFWLPSKAGVLFLELKCR